MKLRHFVISAIFGMLVFASVAWAAQNITAVRQVANFLHFDVDGYGSDEIGMGYADSSDCPYMWMNNSTGSKVFFYFNATESNFTFSTTEPL